MPKFDQSQVYKSIQNLSKYFGDKKMSIVNKSDNEKVQLRKVLLLETPLTSNLLVSIELVKLSSQGNSSSWDEDIWLAVFAGG